MRSPRLGFPLLCLLSCLAFPSVFSFKIAIVSDIHIGRGTDVYNTTIENFTTQYAREVVSAINSRITSGEDIRFVILSGDITESAQTSEYVKAKEIFDALKVPYLPIIGNHDVWTYTKYDEEPFPTGDIQFGKFFAPNFASTSKGNCPMTFHYEDRPVFNPEHNITSWFQNVWYRPCVAAGAPSAASSLVVISLDFCTRHHAAMKEPGTLPKAEIHDFPGGTLRWLDEQLAAIKKEGTPAQIVLVQHHPFRTPIFEPAPIATFTSKEKAAIRAVLAKHFPISKYWGVIAGHIHRWYDGRAFDESEWATFRQWETDACFGQWDDKKVHSTYTVIDVATNPQGLPTSLAALSKNRVQ